MANESEAARNLNLWFMCLPAAVWAGSGALSGKVERLSGYECCSGMKSVQRMASYGFNLLSWQRTIHTYIYITVIRPYACVYVYFWHYVRRNDWKRYDNLLRQFIVVFRWSKNKKKKNILCAGKCNTMQTNQICLSFVCRYFCVFIFIYLYCCS